MADPLADVLRSVLCRRLTPAEAGALAHVMTGRTVAAGGLLCREGEPAAGLLLLLRGAAEIVKQGRDGDGQRLATVEAPTVLGEIGLLLAAGAHTATVRAQTECDVRLLPKADFIRMLDAESVAAYKLVATIAEVLARRLTLMDEKVLELAARRDHPMPVEELAAFRQKLFTEWSF
jgi:CRP/FNR family transcriptional regulator, cyclic AMP receptor protein